jgi:hypothetical protein
MSVRPIRRWEESMQTLEEKKFIMIIIARKIAYHAKNNNGIKNE